MSRLRSAAVVFAFFVLHITVFAFVRPFGVAPDVMLLAAVLGGMAGGPDFGARHGFACGLLFDLMASGPFGLAAGVYGAVGHGVGFFSRTVDSQDPRVAPITVALSSFLGVGGYGVGLGILGQEQYVNTRLLTIAGLVALYNLVLAIPGQRGYQWAMARDGGFARTERPRSVVN